MVAEIEAMEENIGKVKEAMAAKGAPMMLAQTRLDLRSHRPNTELVRDPVQYGLISEVGEIAGSVSQLQEKLGDSEGALKGLIRNQLTLEEDIAVKTNSLQMDKDQCMALRSQLDAFTSSS